MNSGPRDEYLDRSIARDIFAHSLASMLSGSHPRSIHRGISNGPQIWAFRSTTPLADTGLRARISESSVLCSGAVIGPK